LRLAAGRLTINDVGSVTRSLLMVVVFVLVAAVVGGVVSFVHLLCLRQLLMLLQCCGHGCSGCGAAGVGCLSHLLFVCAVVVVAMTVAICIMTVSGRVPARPFFDVSVAMTLMGERHVYASWHAFVSNPKCWLRVLVHASLVVCQSNMQPPAMERDSLCCAERTGNPIQRRQSCHTHSIRCRIALHCAALVNWHLSWDWQQCKHHDADNAPMKRHGFVSPPPALVGASVTM